MAAYGAVAASRRAVKTSVNGSFASRISGERAARHLRLTRLRTTARAETFFDTTQAARMQGYPTAGATASEKQDP